MNRTSQIKTASSTPPRTTGPRHLQQAWVAQDRILGETQSYLDGWFSRRHSMAEAAGDLAAEMMEAGSDTTRLAAAMTRWQDGARARLQADLRGWLTLCTNCSGHLAREAAQAETEILDNTVEIARRAGHARHATPV